MLLHVGQLSIGAAVPGLRAALTSQATSLDDAFASTESDARSLAGDVASAQTDLAGLLAEQLNVQAAVTAAAEQIAAGPSAALAGVEEAIADILSGNTLAGLQVALGT